MNNLFDDNDLDKLDDDDLWWSRMGGPDAERMRLSELLAMHPQFDRGGAGALNDAQVREHLTELRRIDRHAKRPPEGARPNVQATPEAPPTAPVIAPVTVEKQPEKSLKARWSPDSGYCADVVKLIGDAQGLAANTEANAALSWSGTTALETLKGQGQNQFQLSWIVKDVVFEGAAMPEKYAISARLSAGGLNADTDALLRVFRVPDKAEKAVKFNRSSGVYGWDAAFRIAIAKDRINIKQTLQIKKAWLGKWVTFVTAKDGFNGWGFVKKVGLQWKYWETASSTWQDIPRDISEYAVKTTVFIKSGSDYVSRDIATVKWPEAFPEPPSYEQKKTDWLNNIHSVWDDKFVIHHKQCKSGAKKCCTWRLRVTVNWSDAAGDKLVYAVWAQEWERSNAKDWYLTENRVGVAAHECGHLLGAYDEYTGGAVDTVSNKIETDSIMGQNLTKGHDRHMDGLRDQVKSIINTAIARTWEFEVLSA